MKELVEKFEANGGKIKQIEAGKFFTVKNNPQLNKDCFNFSKNGLYPYFTRTVSNNGILGYVDYLDEEHKISGNCIAVGMLGMKFFYMEHDFYAGQFTKTITPLFKNFSYKISLYFNSQFNRYSKCYLKSLVRDFENLFTTSKIYVPIKDSKLDLNFIENYIDILEEERIHELEQERILELKNYLKASKLDDYKLTNEEQDALDLISNKKIKFKEYRIGELFDIHPTTSYKMTNCNLLQTRGATPVVSNSSINNGITGYVNLAPTEKGGIITYSDTTTSDAIFYQPNDFIGYSHVQGLYAYNKELTSKERLLYIVALFKKSTNNRFNYANKFNRIIASNLFIKLPININNEIDFNFIDTYITAVKKLVIKDVIDKKDKIIKTTKNIKEHMV